MNYRLARRLARNERARDQRVARRIGNQILQHTIDRSVGHLSAHEAMLLSQDDRAIQKQRSQGTYATVTYDPTRR
jgi:hypothetical protein